MLSMLPNGGVGRLGDPDPIHRRSCDIFEEEDEFLDVEDHGDDSEIKEDGKKSSKPVMEKRRRARINSCLDELKSIIVDALNKDPSRHSKLEKADILEMTVKHLQQVQRRQLGNAVSRDPTVLHKFRGGFAECAQEVTRYVSRIESVDTGVKQRLVAHLGQCVSGLQTMTPAAFAAMAGVLPPASPAPHMRPQFPSQQTVYEEPKGGHARALQNLMLARAEAARNVSLPPSLMPKNPNIRHVPVDKPKQVLPTSTPNVSPQTLPSSLPATPQSVKLSPSSSSSLSSDAESQSPPNQSTKPLLSSDKLFSVKMPIRPSHPSIQMKLEEPVLGQLFSASNRSAFTAVKNLSQQRTTDVPSSSYTSSSSFSSQQYTNESTSIAGNPAKYKYIPEGIVAPTARRLAPPVNNETKFTLQKRLSLQVKEEPRSNIAGPNNRETNTETQKRFSSLPESVPPEFPQGPVSTYRKRSLDSLVDENRECKKVKIEVVRDASASCPGPIGQLLYNNNDFNVGPLNDRNNVHGTNKSNNDVSNNNLIIEQQQQNIAREAAQEEKDMWRPW